jgi:hypothetical protein
MGFQSRKVESRRRHRADDHRACTVHFGFGRSGFWLPEGIAVARVAAICPLGYGNDGSHGMLDVFRGKITDSSLEIVKALYLEEGGALPGRHHVGASSMTLHHVKDIGFLVRKFHDVLLPWG